MKRTKGRSPSARPSRQTAHSSTTKAGVPRGPAGVCMRGVWWERYVDQARNAASTLPKTNLTYTPSGVLVEATALVTSCLWMAVPCWSTVSKFHEARTTSTLSGKEWSARTARRWPSSYGVGTRVWLGHGGGGGGGGGGRYERGSLMVWRGHGVVGCHCHHHIPE